MGAAEDEGTGLVDGASLDGTGHRGGTLAEKAWENSAASRSVPRASAVRRDRTRREGRAGDKAQQRTETFDGRGADKMQARHARFQSGAQQRRTVHAGNPAQKFRRQNADPRNIDAIAGAEQDVVEHARAVIQIEHDAIRRGARRNDRAAGTACDARRSAA